MKSTSSWRIRLAQILLGAAIVIALVVVRGTKAGSGPVHMATDWSHHHLIFSAPKSLGEHVRLLANPRYVQQLVRRSAGSGGNGDDSRWSRAPETPDTLNGDWSLNMGSGATLGAGNYAAKYSFDENSANCANVAAPAEPDFVVYNTSLAGSSTSSDAHQTATFTTSGGTPAGHITIAGTLVLTASGTLNTGDDFRVANDGSGTNRDANATNLAAAIARNGAGVGVTATAAGDVVTITATTGGTTGNSITLTSTVTHLTLGGATLTGGTAPQASIIAYDNLYSGCSGGLPTTYWAYNTGGTVQTSVALSGDGSQVAFVQTVGTAAHLVLLKWAESGSATYDNPVTLTSQTTAALYRSCTAPCMYSIPFSGAANDTNSSPFYDFAPGSDAMYVGDNDGKLHKFTGVFNGDPAEVVATWPITLTAGNILTSPVYDGSSTVYVGDGAFPADGGGMLYAVNATSGAKVTSSRLGWGVGFVASPILDTTNGVIYLFSADDTPGCPGSQNAVIQMNTGFAAGAVANGTSRISATATTCSTTQAAYDGTFDNLYYSGSAGNLYVCGNMSTTTAPTLYRVAITAAGLITGTPAVASAGPALAAAGNSCGPTTEVYNPNATTPTDWIFTSVQGGGVVGGVIGCPTATGCIMSFNVTAGTTPTATVGHTAAAGGASGIIIDNTVGSGTLAGASQIYFTPLSNQTCTTAPTGTGGCAIQASQADIN